ncbi:hypothetical protein KIH74_28715 [Kineosporia sp. J2-2]|uniref:Uncharacterized protein n=1 Tax=Kineosporia corallincola TaxID=2835133 RepID=A0ABS5TPN3_9ACTN|nr:hypothetical protein [Kineosporia corallincola]MBT0772960.1 hypothetical protein [Kineosporia corallincola]
MTARFPEPVTPAVPQDPITALIIPADDAQPLRAQTLHGETTRALQQLVHGAATRLLLEEGSRLYHQDTHEPTALATNARATALLLAVGGPAAAGAHVRGDAVVLGPLRHGRETSAPPRLLGLTRPADHPAGARHVDLTLRARHDPDAVLTASISWLDACAWLLRMGAQQLRTADNSREETHEC